GITELTGDIVIQCTGGTATIAPNPIPQSNVTVSLNTNITSRLLGSGYIDSLLLIDEPVPTSPNPSTAPLPPNPAGFAAPVQQSAPCFSNTLGSQSNPVNCNVVAGTTAATDPYAFPNSNIYVAHQVAANTITWLGVPIDAP